MNKIKLGSIAKMHFFKKKKFKSKNLNLNGFKSLLKTYVTDLKTIHEGKESPEKSIEWNNLYNIL